MKATPCIVPLLPMMCAATRSQRAGAGWTPGSRHALSRRFSVDAYLGGTSAVPRLSPKDAREAAREDLADRGHGRRVPEQLLHRGHRRLGMATGVDEREIRHIQGHVERHAVRDDPALDGEPDRRDLAAARPHAAL